MKNRQYGFTLIELMITVAIIGIIASIAYPSYREFILSARRVDAKNSLLDLASRQQKFYSINNRFSFSATDLGYTSFPFEMKSGNGAVYYIVSLESVNSGKNWVATANPNGDQLKDVCGSFTLTDKGVQSYTGTTSDKNKCW